MKKNYLLIKVFLLLLIVSACSKDDDGGSNPVDRSEFAVAFENPSASFADDEETKELKLVFSRPAPEAGKAVINYTTVNADYNSDFITSPTGETGTITVDIRPGTNESVFTFNKQGTIDEVVTKTVTFYLESLSYDYATISGNTDLVVSYSETPALGGVIEAEIGGPNEPNQVFIDLSSQTQTAIKRDTWDLGFYGGDEFRVILNGSLYMATAALDATDIDAVTEADVADLQSLVGLGAAGTDGYVDDPSGDITKTAITEISATDADNKVYLLSLGNEIGTEPPASAGGVNITGDPRGWKKIRILKSGDDYILQYADLDATTHNEVTISKDSDYNFTFYSFNTDEVVNVEPAKDKWDIKFSIFTNVLDFGGGVGGAYGFSDFVVNNIGGGTQAYLVSTDDFAYDDFVASNVVSADFETDQRAIGSNWRSVFSGTVGDDLFFVLKDAYDNIYKIRFTALLNESGERGHSSFEYTLLQ